MRSFDFALDPDQQKIVDATDVAIQVCASAGSGKTEVVARRVERLIDESDGSHFHVLALSYTVKAAEALRQRLEARLGDRARRLRTETIHSLAHYLLRENGTLVGLPLEPELLIRPEDQAEALVRWCHEMGRSAPHDVDAFIRKASVDIARMTETDESRDWRAALDSVQAIDFATSIEKAIELLAISSPTRRIRQRFHHLIVDEAQNLTALQYRFLQLLAGNADSGDAMNSMFVGDENQCIVSFAGGDSRYFTSYESDFAATKFELRRNYRSAAAIVETAEAIGAQLTGVDPVAVQTSYAAPGQVDRAVFPTEEDEAAGVAGWVADLLEHGVPAAASAPTDAGRLLPEEVAILARTNGALRLVETELHGRDIAGATAVARESWLASADAQIAVELMNYRQDPGKHAAAWELGRILQDESVHDLESVEQMELVLSGSDNPTWRDLAKVLRCETGSGFVSCVQSIDVPSDDAAAGAMWWDDVETIESAWTQFTLRLPAIEQTWSNFMLDLSRQWRGRDLDPGVRLLTVHGSQGKEFRAVAIMGMNDGQFPDFRETTPAGLAAELRTFYVAVSRPSRLLFVTRAAERSTRYGSRATEPSPFLEYLASD